MLSLPEILRSFDEAIRKLQVEITATNRENLTEYPYIVGTVHGLEEAKNIIVKMQKEVDDLNDADPDE